MNINDALIKRDRFLDLIENADIFGIYIAPVDMQLYASFMNDNYDKAHLGNELFIDDNQLRLNYSNIDLDVFVWTSEARKQAFNGNWWKVDTDLYLRSKENGFTV